MAPSPITRIDQGDILAGAVVHNGIAYLSGFTAEPPEGKDVAQQTRETLATIDAYLARAGSDRTRLLTARIWLADIADFDAMNREWLAWLGDGPRPVRACVGAPLAGAAYRVEIMVTAAVA